MKFSDLFNDVYAAKPINPANIAIKICLTYALSGALWILYSDHLAAAIASDIHELHTLNLYKGWAFIIATTVLLYLLANRLLNRVFTVAQKLLTAHRELELSYEELSAADEELRQQYDELQNQTSTILACEFNYRNLFDNMLNGFALHELVYDANGRPVDYRFLAINPAFERLTGLKAAEVIGKTALEVLPNIEPYWFEAYAEVATTGHPRSFTQYSRELNRYYEVEAYSPESGKFAVQFLDCTERVLHHEEVEYMAFFDALTKLPNRYSLHIRLQDALTAAAAKSEKLAVILLDLDDFKLVNDTLGHFAGDELLKVIGERLTCSLRCQDTIARLGGDEFMIIINNVQSPASVDKIAQKLIAAVAQPWHYNNAVYHMTCKLGIALCPDSGQDADTLMKQADIAMYKAKELGKGYYQYYFADMATQVNRRLQIESELHTAIAEQQFVLYYQPQCDADGHIVGVEALLRWLHPEKGLIPPMDFIPIAEETGQIIKIGEWALKAACQQSRAWLDSGLSPVSMAVNLSARQFHQHDLLTTVFSAIADAGINPETLTLEITETVAMQNADYTAHVLQALQAKDIRIALDDFGIGYSSLLYLKRFPIDSLKIDRSFIKDIYAHSEGEIIVRIILALAKSLKYIVVAEGVETCEQLTYLKQQHCDYMQGYLFSKPLPAREMTALLNRPAAQRSVYIRPCANDYS